MAKKPCVSTVFKKKNSCIYWYKRSGPTGAGEIAEDSQGTLK